MSYLDIFNPTQRNAFKFVRMGVAEGLSANKIGDMLRASGMGMRRSVMQKMVRDIRGAAADTSLYLPENPFDKPVPELIPPTFTRQTKQYRYVVEADLINPLTKDPYTKSITLESNFLISEGDILDQSLELMGEYGEFIDPDVSDVRLSLIEQSFTPVIIR